MKIQVVLIVIASLFPGRVLFAQDAEQKPNILWIITDDQRPDSIVAFNRIRRSDADSLFGKVLSPNIDRLASMGTTFIDTSMVVDYVRTWELTGDAIGSDTQELRKPTKK